MPARIEKHGDLPDDQAILPSRRNSSGSSTTGTHASARVSVKNSFSNRFFEPMVLLDVLNATCIKKPPGGSDTSPHPASSPEHIFQCFVNKLAQLCDICKGGKTVTAFTVLQYPDQIEYRFASNQQETSDLDRAKDFTISVLHILDNLQKQDKENAISSILRTSLSFSRPRVTVYLRTLEARATSCTSVCETENTDECRSIIEKLKKLYEGPLFPDSRRLKDEEFAKHCESLIKSIEKLYQSDVHGLIINRTKEGRIDESEMWSDLRHTTGRLLSYLQTAKFFVSVSKRWPELFDAPRVCYVASSIPDPCPFRGRHSSDKMTADGIIGRMTSDGEKMEQFRAHAQELQKFGLDGLLKTQAKGLRPIVHAEVLLHDSIEKEGITHPSRFFNGFKYIGCSKPSCRLCWHYFSLHPSGIEVRRSHRNVYSAWRMPDVHQNQGPKAEKNMIKLMDSVLLQIKTDAFRVLKEKLAERKRHDSNTDTSYPKLTASVRSVANMEDLTQGLRNLEVYSSDHEDGMSRIVEIDSSYQEENEDSTDEADCEESGGVKLS